MGFICPDTENYYTSTDTLCRIAYVQMGMCDISVLILQIYLSVNNVYYYPRTNGEVLKGMIKKKHQKK